MSATNRGRAESGLLFHEAPRVSLRRRPKLSADV
jgi:hypothetical protein